MKNKVIEYLKQNKLFFLILLIIILIICYISFFSKLFTIEGLNNEIYQQQNPILNNYINMNIQDIIGKYIHLKCMKNVIDKNGLTIQVPYYLALMKKTDCINAFPEFGNDCNYNMAILQSTKNNFSTFYLTKEVFNNVEKYSLRSILDSINPSRPPLSQNLHMLYSSPFMCFDEGMSDTIYFELENTNKGYLLKFNVPDGKPAYFYLSECKDIICQSVNETNFSRLCVYASKNYALAFTFELSSFQPIMSSVENEDTLNINKYNKPDTVFDIDSLKTLISSGSDQTLISLTGADNVSKHMETFMPYSLY